MKFVLLTIFLFNMAICQSPTTFTDHSRGYQIPIPPNTLMLGGCYHWPAHPDNTDTTYIKIVHRGKRVLFGDFTQMFPKDSGFREYAINHAIAIQSGDGPDGSVYCENIDSVQILQNRYGVTYAELFLKKVSTASPRKKEIVGPYYIIDISSKNKREVLCLDWRSEWKPTNNQKRISRAIVANIKLLHK